MKTYFGVKAKKGFFVFPGEPADSEHIGQIVLQLAAIDLELA